MSAAAVSAAAVSAAAVSMKESTMRCRFVALVALLLLLTTAIFAPGATAANPQVIPGNTVMLTPTTFQAPTAGWAVYGPDGTLVANQGGPGNWTVTDALSSNGQTIASITVTVPLGTALGTGYKVVYAGPGSNDAALFDVVASSTPPPAAPTALTATTISPSQINLTWTAPTGTVTSYNVKRGTATGGPYTTVGSPTTTSYASTGLASGTRYYYVITAVNAGGESVPSAEISRATQCAAPTGLTATATTTQIGLAWTTTKGATSYNLYRGTSSGTETVYQSGLTGTSYTDTSVTAVTAYYYTLTAVNSAGESVASAEISSATLCAAPTNLTATTVSPSQINLTWTASAGATSYNISGGTTSGGPYTPIGSTATTSYSSTGLASGTRYYYVITAVNAGGESVPSAEISRATQCAAPTGLTATSTATQIGLTWATTKGATSYSLYRGTSAGGESGTAYQSSLTGTSYTDTAVTVGTAYYYTLKALNSGGTSAASNETSATPGVVSLSSVSVSPASVTGGTAATGTVTLSGAAPAGGVVVTLSDNSASVTVPASVTVAAGSSTANFPVTTTSVTSATTATITATYSGVSKATTLTVNPAPATVNFSLSTYPSRLTLTQGLSSTLTLSILPTGGFNGNVTLTNSALPTGVTLAYGTNPATSTSVLTFTATASAVLGQTLVTLTGTSGSLIKTVVIPLTVAPQVSGADTNIALASGVGEVSLTTGSSTGGSTLLTITPVNGYIGPVSFAATGLPSGVSVVTSPTTVSIAGTTAQTTVATFKATSTVTPGYYAVGITGSGNDGATNTVVLGLNILPPTNTLPFTLTVTDSATNAIPNGTASAVVTLSTTGGYSKSIALSLIDDPSAPVLGPANTTDPTKIGVSFSQTSLSASGTSAVTLTVGASVAPGAYHFLVSGLSTDGSVQHAAFTLFVAPEGSGTAFGIEGILPSQTYTGDNPTYPLAASIGDMQRFDFDPGSVFEVGSGGHTPVGASLPLVLEPNAPAGNAGVPDGTDDRKYVAFTVPPPYTYPYRACVRIKACWSSTYAQVGSGTLIGKNHILTAAHVIYDPVLGMAKTIYVMPGYDYNWSQSHSLTYTTANHGFVANGYLLGAKYTSHNNYSYIYDDWAVLDCNPVTNGPGGRRGGPIGNYTQYMQLDNTDFLPLPDYSTHIAGYPGLTWAPASPVLTGGILGSNPDLFETFVYNGDDGPVDSSPEPGLINYSPDLLFSTMDFSHGDSGAGLWYFSDDDSDYHVYGVVDAIVGWNDIIGHFGSTGASAQITGTRYSIIKTQEKLDGDEPPDVYTP